MASHVFLHSTLKDLDRCRGKYVRPAIDRLDFDSMRYISISIIPIPIIISARLPVLLLLYIFSRFCAVKLATPGEIFIAFFDALHRQSMRHEVVPDVGDHGRRFEHGCDNGGQL